MAVSRRGVTAQVGHVSLPARGLPVAMGGPVMTNLAGTTHVPLRSTP